jgi:hypothetical protein
MKMDPVASADDDELLEERFLSMFSEPAFTANGVSNTALRARFGQADYMRLAPVINSFLASSRLAMSRGGKNELFYTLILEKMNQAKISKVSLGTSDAKQLMQTLVYDHAVEEVYKEQTMAEAAGEVGDDEQQIYYVASRRVSTMCDFKMWSVPSSFATGSSKVWAIRQKHFEAGPLHPDA